MKTQAIILLLLWPISGCKNTGTESSTDQECVSSLSSWIVPDTSVVHLSQDVPSGSSECSFVLHLKPGYSLPWPDNSIYKTITVPSGTHLYLLSFFGKKKGEMGGGVFVHRNRPTSANAMLFATIAIVDTFWRVYSYTDTLSTVPSDTIFVTISGGGGEYDGTTYINTVKFDRLD